MMKPNWIDAYPASCSIGFLYAFAKESIFPDSLDRWNEKTFALISHKENCVGKSEKLDDLRWTDKLKAGGKLKALDLYFIFHETFMIHFWPSCTLFVGCGLHFFQMNFSWLVCEIGTERKRRASRWVNQKRLNWELGTIEKKIFLPAWRGSTAHVPQRGTSTRTARRNRNERTYDDCAV